MQNDQWIRQNACRFSEDRRTLVGLSGFVEGYGSLEELKAKNGIRTADIVEKAQEMAKE